MLLRMLAALGHRGWCSVNATEATRRLTVLSLLETAARMEVRPGLVAAKYCHDCWETIAELETGCNCFEAARTLVLSAEHWLEVAA